MDWLAMNFKQLLILHYRLRLSLNGNFEMARCLSSKLIDLNQQDNRKKEYWDKSTVVTLVVGKR